jgi:transglutaminase-like putative cysteine protease
MIKPNDQPSLTYRAIPLRIRRLAVCLTPHVTRSHARARVAATSLAMILFAAGVVSLWAGDAAPAASFVSSPSSISFDFSYVVRIKPLPGSRKVRVWIPLPSSDQYQTISQMQLSGPIKVQVHKEPKYGDRYAYFDVDSARVKAAFEIRLAFHVVRYERRSALISTADSSRPFPKPLPKPFPKEVLPFLQAGGPAPVDETIASLSRQQTQGISDPLQKARRIYDVVTSAINREPVGSGTGLANALWTAVSHRDDCTDFNSLLIDMARAAGIPARLAVGFSLPNGQKQGTISGYHSWAEFYVNGFGWIPVDVWQASQDPSKRDYFFGALDAHRVMVSIGRDVALTPAPQAGRLEYVAYPYPEAGARLSPVASLDVFFNAPGVQSAAPTIFRHPTFARAVFTAPPAAS